LKFSAYDFLTSLSTQLFELAGCRPGSRSTFHSGKVDKTIDAQFGLIGWDGRQACGGRTNSLRSNKARQVIWASDPKAELQASDLKKEKEIEAIPGYMN